MKNKKLERLNSNIFNAFELLNSTSTMRIIGGAETKTDLPEGRATSKNVAPNCQRADKIEKDAYKWVGDIICTEPKDTTVVTLVSLDQTDPSVFVDVESAFNVC
ncbi:MAG: hypothetical protein IT237_09315 [Bacteroidia bacterium]|nr:hypothetical protein [Bacteroidia bacterium]